jgi:hypothetical protein
MIPDVSLWQLKLLLRRLSREPPVPDSSQCSAAKCVSAKEVCPFPTIADAFQVDDFEFNEETHRSDENNSKQS